MAQLGPLLPNRSVDPQGLRKRGCSQEHVHDQKLVGELVANTEGLEQQDAKMENGRAEGTNLELLIVGVGIIPEVDLSEIAHDIIERIVKVSDVSLNKKLDVKRHEKCDHQSESDISVGMWISQNVDQI